MGRSAIRIGQLISTFGPGSIIVDRYGTSLIVCGLDKWFYRESENEAEPKLTEGIDEFRFSEWRLENRLAMDYFMCPPDYRIPQTLGEGAKQTPNVNLHIPTLRFPSYFMCGNSNCSTLRPAEFHLSRRPTCQEHDGYNGMNQVRFITVCKNGHIDDFPWRKLIGCAELDQCRGKLKIREQGSADLTSIRVSCSCGKSANLGGVTSFVQDENGVVVSELSKRIRTATGVENAGKCRGRCLWHGPDHFEECGEEIVATFPNATNVYHSRTSTSIFIPIQQSTHSVINELADFLKGSVRIQVELKAIWNFDTEEGTADAAERLMQLALQQPDRFTDHEFTSEQCQAALDQVFDGKPALQEHADEPVDPEEEETAFRRVEYNVIRQSADEPKLRTRIVETPKQLQTHVGRVVQVERLQETRVLYGFDRFITKQTSGSSHEIGEEALQQLFSAPPEQGKRWLPGTVVFGEGIYFELNEDCIHQWQREQQDWIEQRLKGECNFAGRIDWSDFQIAPVGETNPDWISRYMLLHTTAHIVINQLVFECGYSTASLRERLYVSADPAAPQAGILIYTSAGDSEGTLGGLVRLAEPERFSSVLTQACQRAAWCSADPVCSEVTNDHDFNLAACHSCALLPETSCENFNKALDRAMLIGTPKEPDRGFFSSLLTTSSRITIN